MEINRSGPPMTHDSVMWRVPLSGPPSVEWQHAFEVAEASSPVMTPRGVRFERMALTFRCDDAHVPEWVAAIDRWIAHANAVQAGLTDEQARAAARRQEQTDTRRQTASEANERFKNL